MLKNIKVIFFARMRKTIRTFDIRIAPALLRQRYVATLISVKCTH